MKIRIKACVDCVSSAPVILDPNTAYPYLLLSDDLTGVRYGEDYQTLPDNPERIDQYECVLGSEGFNSGTHCWDVDVTEGIRWALGVTTASKQRKKLCFFDTYDVWSVRYDPDGIFSSLFRRSSFHFKQKLDRVRVNLDYNGGTVSFSDPVTNTHLHTLTATFTHTLFPFFQCFLGSLRILAVNSQ